MKLFIILMSIIFCTGSFDISAHSNHHHSHKKRKVKKKSVVSVEQTVELAKQQIKRLITDEKIDPSWENAMYTSSEKKKFDEKYEWVIIFSNEKGIKGQTLYIFLKLTGEYIAANFTGK
jgi:hypothetical protein